MASLSTDSDFNPRSYKRSDFVIPLLTIPVLISIHAPTRGATSVPSVLQITLLFQSTLLQEERHLHPGTATRTATNFNPRSYKRSDICCICIPNIFDISIHAPTRGATICLPPYKFQASNFNPRSYKRSDDVTMQHLTAASRISIHAPTRGATQSQSAYFRRPCISIHAPTRGATGFFSKAFKHFNFNPRSYKRSDCKWC